MEEQSKRYTLNDTENVQQTNQIRELEFKIQQQSNKIDELTEKEVFYRQQFKEMS